MAELVRELAPEMIAARQKIQGSLVRIAFWRH